MVGRDCMESRWRRGWQAGQEGSEEQEISEVGNVNEGERWRRGLEVQPLRQGARTVVHHARVRLAWVVAWVVAGACDRGEPTACYSGPCRS